MYQKTFTADFNNLHQALFCILLLSKHTFSQAKLNFYYKPALLLQTLEQTAMQIFYILFFIFW